MKNKKKEGILLDKFLSRLNSHLNITMISLFRLRFPDKIYQKTKSLLFKKAV